MLLLNLLIAAFNQTYTEVRANLDTEWKFLRARLLHQFETCSCMFYLLPYKVLFIDESTGTPAPLNLVVDPLVYVLRMCGISMQPGQSATVDQLQRAEEKTQLEHLLRKLVERRQASLDLASVEATSIHANQLDQLMRSLEELRAIVIKR